MRRVAPDEAVKGAAHLEKLFSKSLKNKTYERELESGALCDLGECWQMVSVLLTGEDFPAEGVESLPVLGGEPIATQGEQVDVLLVLEPRLVRIASDFLQGVDSHSLVSQNKGKLRVVGGATDWMVSQLVTDIEALKKFYLEAATGGSAVTKRVYS
ncbi:DUF1877 family protein [Streptomyces sp. NPDC002851]